MSGTISATTAALIAAGVGAAGVGTSIYEGQKSSDASAAATAAQQQAAQQAQQAQANQANLTKQEAVLGAQGQAQQQTGGSLTDPGTASLTDLLAGYPGYQGGSSSSVTGSGAGTGATTAATAATGAASTPDITSILAALRNGAVPGGLSSGGLNSLSGGNWQPPATQPQQYQQLANPPLV